MYTPEEFAQSLKRRGYVKYISDARRYVEKTGKDSFYESDFEEAYHELNTNPVGRIYYKDQWDGEDVYFKRIGHGGHL